jgi:hypothetical protein
MRNLKAIAFFSPYFWGFLAIFTLSGCSSTPSGTRAEAPAWINQATRTVDNGYIVYVGIGEDNVPERARFKAEGMAIQDLANECSFAPKGTRVEDHYDQPVGVIFRSYAKVGIAFQDCDDAKAAIQPAEIQKLASAPLTQELKRYQDAVDTPEDEETVASASEGSGANPMIYRTTPIQNDSGFFVVRQQVAFMKEDVILVPQNYPPNSPQSQTFVQQVAPAQNSVQTYETAHPVVRTWPQSFSANRPNAFAHQPSALRSGKAVTASQAQAAASRRGQFRGNHPGGHGPGSSNKKGQNPHQKKRRRRSNGYPGNY